MSCYIEQVERNLKALSYEKQGEIDRAIALYEKNIAENFIGDGPYERLAIIYRRKKQYLEEKRVILKAIETFVYIVPEERRDRLPKLKKFQERLQKVNKLIEK